MKIDFSGFGNGSEADLHFQWSMSMADSKWDEAHIHWRSRPSIFVFHVAIYKVRLHFSTMAKWCWPNFQIDLFDFDRKCWSELLPCSMPTPSVRHHCHHSSFCSARVLMVDDEAAARVVGCNDLYNMFGVECASVRMTQFHSLFVFRHSVSNTAVNR